MTAVATYDPATGRVTLAGMRHKLQFPAGDLPRWTAVYRQLRDRAAGMYASFYADDVAALEAVADAVRIATAGTPSGRGDLHPSEQS